MNRFLPLLVLVGVLGCASSPSPFLPEDPAPAGTSLALEIQLIQSDWIVRVNRPAAVALFEIVPNQGAGLLFPEPSRESGDLSSGATRILAVDRRLILRHRTRYLQPWNAGGLVGHRSEIVDEATGPTVIIGVACECELNLDVLARLDGPRMVLGTFNGLDPLFAAQALAEAVLPSPEVTWTMARYEYALQDLGGD